MDINRSEIPGPPSFAEHFSDSSNNGEITRIQQGDEEENTQKKDGTPTAREGDIDNGNSNGSPATTKTAVSMGKLNTNMGLSKPIRDEKDIKMEETSLSPHASPLGIGQSTRDVDDNGTPTLPKTSNLSPLSCDKSTFFRNGGCNDLQERSKSAGLMSTTNVNAPFDGGNTNNVNISPKSNSDNAVANNSNLARNLNPFNGNSKYNCSQGESQGTLNSSGGSGGSEYMQQQNHVFVFSTQLANKSAEAVVGGQFPTIIAYHCMQPSTKLFLEDFLKNPAKTSKMQRQYSLNIMSLMQSGLNRNGSQSFWLNECNNSNKGSQRPPGLRSVGGVNKNSPGWDQSAVLDNQVCAPSNSLDLLNTTDCFDNVQAAIKDEDKSNIPSLQGVKVPDENLTPQQRQHREEQLAKLKKMNKFLFPENEGQDFNPSHSNSSVPPDAVANSSTSTGELLHTSAGNCSDAHNISGNSCKQSVSGQGGSNLEGVTNLGDGDDSDMMSADMMATGESNMQPNACISKMNTSNMSMIKSRGRNDDQINASNENNQDMSSFNMNSCPSSEAESIRGPSNINMPHEEWSKFQNNAFADSFKSRQTNPIHATNLQVSQQNSSLSRSLSMGVGGYGMQSRPNTGPSPTNRNNNGPPPPYHHTQRSASVPIATQSPTNVNSNNVNADMPTPSPHASRASFGVASTPPNMETMSNSSTINTNSTQSSTTSFAGGGNQKNIYSRDGSSNVANSNQSYSHSSSVLNSLNANPPNSLSHISHREMIDCIDSGHKSKRSSPHKSPIINEMQDNNCMEPKYTNFGLNYSTGGMPPINAQNMRQNMQQMPSQFCRRIDNIPLNPNCNRVNQNKPVSNFDPIASLAQMSQQLTGSSMGLSTLGVGNNVTAGLMDVNTGELMVGPSGRTGDPVMDHCNQMSNNNLGMVGLGGSQILPNPNFNHNALTGVGLRDTSVGCNDMTSSNRTTVNRRMQSNFDNFSMNPNIHVKVSAPNTIQYMPARSQNLNMRVPPSIEFFQRYANPQIMGNVGHPSGHVPNDIGNPNMMNMFGNCGQIPSGGGRGGGGFEQNDLGIEGNLIPNDAYMNVP